MAKTPYRSSEFDNARVASQRRDKISGIRALPPRRGRNRVKRDGRVQIFKSFHTFCEPRSHQIHR